MMSNEMKKFIDYWERECDYMIEIAPDNDRMMMQVTHLNKGYTESVCIGNTWSGEETWMRCARAHIIVMRAYDRGMR